MLGGSAAASAAPGDAPPALIEMIRFQLRNSPDNQSQRMTEFLSKIFAPALKRAGAGPLGFFSPVIAPDSPFLMALITYPRVRGAWESTNEKLAQDAEYLKDAGAWLAQPGLHHQRAENSLLRAFRGMPTVEPPPVAEGRAPRIFELRTYESNNRATLARKIDMFEKGEIALFRKCGLLPVFFGDTIVGRNVPNLTYMVAFDDLAAREANWKAFGGSPEWQKMRSTPGWEDAQIVSNISNIILRPLPFSDIR
jgi:hypothetical protein